jgi:alkanesulfonate monooxygenase SsuD/methylene tetrahydromethanopterin reductase-like flavin-dependent oxidoreductase (luciferase family)
MKIGVGLPATIPGVTGPEILEWARRADDGPFSSLGIIDRLVYPNYEPLVTLAAVAGTTRLIRLMSTILIAPLCNAGLLAKQATCLDVFSGGRLTLGLGIGGREDDFRAAPARFKNRGRRFEQQLEWMRRIWSGQSPAEGQGPIGPHPISSGGPEVLFGGYTPAAIQRVGRWGDGYISGGGGDPARVRQLYSIAEESWKANGRPGRPRFVGAIYCAVGQDVVDQAADYLRDYYGFMGPMAENMARSVPTSPDDIKERILAFAKIGMDERILWPYVPGMEQLNRFASLVSELANLA